MIECIYERLRKEVLMVKRSFSFFGEYERINAQNNAS